MTNNSYIMVQVGLTIYGNKPENREGFPDWTNRVFNVEDVIEINEFIKNELNKIFSYIKATNKEAVVEGRYHGIAQDKIHDVVNTNKEYHNNYIRLYDCKGYGQEEIIVINIVKCDCDDIAQKIFNDGYNQALIDTNK